ncbi:MAG: FAD-dependent monooxygenase [Betaproteobacteria bacterium]|nr:FAD-dependent monooxygenase [Betaproteobacteria bacterium]
MIPESRSAIEFDVVVAGGGPVGAMLCRALREGEISFLQVRGEARGAERPIALSYGSWQLMAQFGTPADATPIRTIHVSQAGRFGRTLMRAEDYGLPALGYVANYSSILAALTRAGAGEAARVTGWQAHGERIEVQIEGALGVRSASARLLVIADGGDALAKETTRDYGQTALVAEIETARPHGNVAWERFTPSGPIGLLPYRNRYALIWSIRSETAESLEWATDAEFLARLSAAFGARAGAFLRAGPRASFPLALRYREIAPGPRVILIGNAAQTLHPVAGQGLNLGLRDACELADLVADVQPREIGGAAFVRRYRRQRRLDRSAGMRITDALVRVFSNSNPLLSAARGAGLLLLDIVPPARHFLARRMIYGARALP